MQNDVYSFYNFIIPKNQLCCSNFLILSIYTISDSFSVSLLAYIIDDRWVFWYPDITANGGYSADQAVEKYHAVSLSWNELWEVEFWDKEDIAERQIYRMCYAWNLRWTFNRTWLNSLSFTEQAGTVGEIKSSCVNSSWNWPTISESGANDVMRHSRNVFGSKRRSIYFHTHQDHFKWSWPIVTDALI